MKEDIVNHPKHYTSHPSGVECITITEHMGFNLGNVTKYVWRADAKNGVEDLRKAAWYLEREIARREGIDAALNAPLIHDPNELIASATGRPTHGVAIAKVRGKYKKKPIGRYTPEELREPMIAFVKKNPGCKAEQIREAIGAKPTQMPTLRVLTSHAVKTKGAKRSTTYWPRGGK